MTPCLIYSATPEWSARIGTSLNSFFSLLHLESPARVQAELAQNQNRVLLLDMQSPDSLDLLSAIIRSFPNTLVIALGMPGCDPMLQAAQLGVYATESDEVDRRRLAALVQRAHDLASLAAENRLLRQESVRLTATAEAAQRQPAPDQEAAFDIRDFAAALRHFTHVETLLHRLVDEVAGALRVSRVGIFCRTRDVASYRLRSGLRCLESTGQLDYPESHPHVLWLTVNTHAICRFNLEHIKDPTTRLMLQDMLDQMGAEVILPLQSHNRLLGWLFVGHLSTGQPFEDRHLHNLISLTECVSTTLENALLYEEVTIQKTLAETLLHSMSSGIIAVDDSGIVRWYNEAAQILFGVSSDAAIGRPIEKLGSPLANLLRGTLGESGAPQSEEWVDQATHRNLSTRTQRLSNQDRCLGAVAIVQDTTAQKTLKAQQDKLDRATFWTELAASLSHEIRNPLVAIKTFAQLLPERYADKEFQNEFKDLVSSEIERLNGIVDQIHVFANPPPLVFKPLSLKRCLEVCVSRLFPPIPPPKIRVTTSLQDALPNMMGDERALSEAFTHIMVNSVEALAATPRGEITITLALTSGIGAPQRFIITFKDNGPGIPPSLLEKVFSPFSTTKARGLGLGLPIVRRTIMDHCGDIMVHSNEFGVLITIHLPLTSPGMEPPS